MLTCAFLQWHSGAYSSDVSGNPDEAAHVVSGLMVHDYLAHFFVPRMASWPSNPRTYAEAYYAHFPKVAIGHWPPLFYVVQAIWMFAFGRTKTALLALMLVTMAAAACLLMHLARSICGEFAAFVFTLAFLLLPIAQQSLYTVMPDALLALLSIALMIACGNALEGKQRWWIACWVLIVAAISVHLRGAALFPVPWIAMVLARRRELFKQRILWIATALTLCVAAPWLLFTHQAGSLRFASVLDAAVSFPTHAFWCLGPILFVLCVAGAILAPYRKQPRWAAVTGMLLGTWVFSSLAIVPWDDRYFVCALPASIVLATLGLRSLAIAANKILGGPLQVAVFVPTVLVAAVSVVQAFPLERKQNLAYEPLVARILASPEGIDPVYLIAGDALHEGDFIASVAFQDPAVDHIVVRSTKALAVTDWGMNSYRPRFQSSAEMAAALNKSWVSLVVIQQDCPRPDVRMLRSAMSEFGWQPVPAQSNLLVFRRSAAFPAGKITVDVDMGWTLGKDIQASP